ncbi:MAG: Trk system potassium transporter TrkA, partial [Bacteroidota bacterium]
LSKENQDITLIDTDEEVLHYASSHLDVMTLKGDVSSLKVLKEANVSKAQLFIAVTTSENTNLLTSTLAKQKGVKKTIARVNNPEYLEPDQKEIFQKLGVDVLISPIQLAAQEIVRLLQRASFTDIFEFENGKISVVGFTVDNHSPISGKTLSEIGHHHFDFPFMGVALLRNHKTIIPRGGTTLRQGDHLYLATQNQCLDKAMNFVGKQIAPIKKVMIIGGTPLALRTAQQLESHYAVVVVLKDKEMGKVFLEELNHTLVTITDPSNVEALKIEGLEQMDAFISLTNNTETNIITSLVAEELGVYKTIALVDNAIYTHISQNIGIDTIINKKLIAANNIFRFVRKGKIEAIASLHGVDAEIIEFEVHKKNRLLKHPIKDLYLPETAIIAGVIRADKSFIPDGNCLLELGDKVIVFALPEAIKKIEELFK